MKFPLFSVIAFLSVGLVATHAASTPEIYWKSMLNDTPMPELLKVLLHPTVIVGESGGGTTIHGVDESTDVQGVYNYAYYKIVRYGQNDYGRSDSKTPHHDNDEVLFFLEKDLKAGHNMNLLFMLPSNNAFFLPREVVTSIPFSSSKMAEILKKFAMKRGSVDADQMKTSIKICEVPGLKGEEKYCATSLESMVDFVTLKLGKSVKALATEVMNQTKVEKYTIMHGVKKVGETQVACHMLKYVYAVFLCHKIDNTIAYTVPLEGADGTRMKAVCVCHRDTSEWNPKHLAFQLLKVNPGTVPVCHFLYQNAILWVPKKN